MAPVVTSMPDSEYFADPAIDQTSLKKFMDSPKAYATYLTSEHETSPTLEFGSAAHSMILGSGATVLIKPDRRTKAGRERYDELVAAHEGEEVIWVKDDDYAKLAHMRDEMADGFTRIPGRPEIAMFADDPATGLRLKGKADWLPDDFDDDGVYRIRDYKTTGKSPKDFATAAWMFDYHIQAAFYMKLARLCGHGEALGFEFIAQQKTPPFDWMIWRMDETSPEIDLANHQIDKALAGIKAFHDNSDDPLKAMRSYGLSHAPQELRFPDWKLAQLEEELDSWRE